MDTNPIPQEQATITPMPVEPTPTPVVAPTPTPTPIPATQPQVMPAASVAPSAPVTMPGAVAPQMVLVQVPMWKNPRMYIAAAAAIIVIAAGIFLSKGNALKGSFDNYDPMLDYKIQAFTIVQPADGSIAISYKIDKAASNLFMAITKPAADDLPENDEMIKLIALADSDLTAGEHKVTLSKEDLAAAIALSGTYRFQIIAYNTNDEITDFKAEKRTITVDKGVVKLVAPTSAAK